MKPAAIDIEVYITLFKIRRNSLPDSDLRMHCFYRTPRCVSNAFAVNGRRNKKQFQLAEIVFCSDNDTAHRFVILHDSEGFTFVYRTGYHKYPVPC